MPLIQVDGLPAIDGTSSFTIAQVLGRIAHIKASTFLAQVCLSTGRVEWLVKFANKTLPESHWELPRRVSVAPPDRQLWYSQKHQVVVDLQSHAKGGVSIIARSTLDGKVRYKKIFPMPAPADWAEKKPAWPGAQTEDIDAFFSTSPSHLVVGLQRQTRRMLHFPGKGKAVDWLPEYACQLDVMSFDPASGQLLWSDSFPQSRVGFVGKGTFDGLWAFDHKMGCIDWVTGEGHILLKSPHEIGEPLRVKTGIAVPWHDANAAGIHWIDDRRRIRECSVPFKKPNYTRLFNTTQGLALQVNDQSLTWFGAGDNPLWTVRAKPYIYQVHAAKDCVMVATDGMGGKLFGFDSKTGKEVLQLKPALGGVGDLTAVPELPLLVSRYSISKSYSKSPQLLILNSRTLKHQLKYDCQQLLATWDKGVICLTGKEHDKVAIIDLSDEV